MDSAGKLQLSITRASWFNASDAQSAGSPVMAYGLSVAPMHRPADLFQTVSPAASQFVMPCHADYSFLDRYRQTAQSAMPTGNVPVAVFVRPVRGKTVGFVDNGGTHMSHSPSLRNVEIERLRSSA